MTCNFDLNRNLFLITALFFLAACSDGRPELRLIEPRLPSDKVIATEFAAVMEEYSSVSVVISASAGIQESSISALLTDRADIALVSNNQPYTNGIAAVMPMYTNILHILRKHTLSASTETELFTSGKVFAGPPGSPSRLMLEHYAAERNIDGESMRFVELFVPDCPDVVVIFASIIPNLHERLEQCGADLYRLHSLGTPEDIGSGSSIDAAVFLNPSLRAFVIPAGTYLGVADEPVVTLAVDKMLVARRDIAPAVIYDLISEIIRLKPALAAKEPAMFHSLADDFSSSGSTFVLHPGAKGYIDRNEPSIYERYSGIAEVTVTIFFALVTGSFAAVRIYNIRRKNRIDRFYAAAIKLRKSVTDDASMSERQDALVLVRKLQTEAFDLLIDEKLAADESFRIFITLSNDIIGELRDPSAPDWAPD